ncbi:MULTISPECIES: hypothetical protein [Hydrogenophaga]|uniref:Uncharacterized protein n=1 Tax=Hydrogenophaga electricum TaxID=1230953 RepID=A0ABQ6CF62_9BURK|nr:MULTISPECIES: hypothetical protein [Hydrogenophaga]GLS16926.1 hypothetical protein GCM10007935_43730 [Hydrogenophaga electricum]
MRLRPHLPLLPWLCLPALAWPQTAAPPAFPPEAQALAPEALRERLVGKSFAYQNLNGSEVRLQFKTDYVYVDTPQVSDSGRWRTEGSALCVEWNRLRGSSGCSEMRAAGPQLYLMRLTTNDVVSLRER